jgi:hypothetical protein
MELERDVRDRGIRGGFTCTLTRICGILRSLTLLDHRIHIDQRTTA